MHNFGLFGSQCRSLKNELRETRLDLSVVGARDDPLGVEADAPDELLVALQHAQARPALDVPQLKIVFGE